MFTINTLDTIVLVPVFLLCFALVHLFKFLRFYLVLIEQKISLRKCLTLYSTTTVANLAIPFKLGELIRMALTGKVVGSMPIGVLSVLTDRFFDTASLLLILVFLILVGGAKGGLVMLLLLALVLVMAFFYLAFLSSFRYLNRYFMLHKNSTRAVGLLKVLDSFYDAHAYLQQLIRGRAGLMIVLSCFGWITEGFALGVLSLLLGQHFDMAAYADYISSIFQTQKGILLTCYSIIGILVLAVLSIALMISGFIGKSNEEKNIHHL